MSDKEGIGGSVVWEQVNGGAPLYEQGRRLYTEEINAAVRGARAGGAERSSCTATARAEAGVDIGA
jgi:D-amino peptidase